MPADPESNDDSSKATQREDPTIFCTAFNKKRFYCLSSREPPTPSALGERDIFNEPPTEDELDRVLESKSKSRKSLPSAAVLHTTMGDITVKLHAEECPRTVENFTTHRL
jgi:peptidylprolyl isomerase domain and WD repeat-containing protein 1